MSLSKKNKAALARRRHNPMGAPPILVGVLAVGLGAGLGAALGAVTKIGKLGTGIDCTQSPTPYPCSAGAGAKVGSTIGTLVTGGIGLLVAAASPNNRDAGLATAGMALLAFPAEELIYTATQPH
jgi:hypothetical protein